MTKNGDLTVNGINVTVYDDTDVRSSLQEKADLGHLHTLSDITDLQTTLDNKADAIHSHTISDITGLDSALVGKASTLHTHLADDITDFDVTNKSNGNVLIWDSTANKFVSKALPAGSGSGATNLDGLSDVDVSTVAPLEGEALVFKNGVWKPNKSVQIEINNTVEDVTLVTPKPVSGITYGNITNNSIAITWLASESSNVSYNLYLDGVLVANTTGLSYDITGLTVSSTYIIGVSSINSGGYESAKTLISVGTSGGYIFSTLGSDNNYIDCPKLSFHTMEIDWIFTDSVGLLPNNLLYSFTDDGTGFKWQITIGNDGVKIQYFYATGESAPLLFIDDVRYQHLNTAPSSGVRRKWRITMNENDSTSIISTEKLRILGNNLGTNSAKGKIYGIKLYEQNDLGNLEVTSYYDFTHQAVGGLVEDLLGNNPALTLVGGSFILG